MNDKVKIALIAAVAAVAITWMVLRHSPYQTCVRASTAFRIEERTASVNAEIAAAAADNTEEYPMVMRTITYNPPPPPTPEEIAAEARRIAEISCAEAR